MRKNNLKLEKYRRPHPLFGRSEGMFGYFEIGELRIISSGHAEYTSDHEVEQWEHVSVSLEDRCPTWDEMHKVKDLFWRDDELVIQFHPPKQNYVNHMPYCLHLWKPPYKVTLPPVEAV